MVLRKNSKLWDFYVIFDLLYFLIIFEISCCAVEFIEVRALSSTLYLTPVRYLICALKINQKMQPECLHIALRH